MLDSDAYTQQLIAYVHLNPVRPADKSALIPCEQKSHLETYPWSSHMQYLGLETWPCWMNSDDSWFERPAWEPQDEMIHGLYLGLNLRKIVEERLDQRHGHDERKWKDRRSREEGHRTLQKLCTSEPDKRIRMWIDVRLLGQRMFDVGQRYGYKSGDGVAKVIKRLEKRAESDPKLAQKLSRLRQKVSYVES